MVTGFYKEEDHQDKVEWSPKFDNALVKVERVIAYLSRILKLVGRHYSPTDREALALWDGLVKFQPYIKGEEILAATDYMALV